MTTTERVDAIKLLERLLKSNSITIEEKIVIKEKLMELIRKI